MKVRVGVLMMQSPTHVFIDKDVVEWLGASGATVVPLVPTVSPAEAAAYFEYIHGLYLHQGWADHPAYTALVTQFVTMAIEANRIGDYFPIWGTCQGMQRLMQHFGGELERFDALHFKQGRFIRRTDRDESRLLQAVTQSQLDHMEKHYVPFFHHEYGISLNKFLKNKRLRSTFRVLSTSRDRDGREYVSLIEGRSLPFYGVQFHPDESSTRLDWLASFFVSEMVKSTHTGFNPGFRHTLVEGVCNKVPCLHLLL